MTNFKICFRFLQVYSKDLTYLVIAYSFNGHVLNAIGQCSQLTTLKINFAFWRTTFPRSWKVYKLKTLYLKYVYEADISLVIKFLKFNPNLERLSLILLVVENLQFEDILKSCPTITKLHLDIDLYNFNIESLLLIPRYLKNLAHLELFFDDKGITKDDYTNLLANLPKLKYFKCFATGLTLIEVSLYFKNFSVQLLFSILLQIKQLENSYPNVCMEFKPIKHWTDYEPFR